MPLLGFTVFKEEIRTGHKRQTIRIHRKRPIKAGDTLYLYWNLMQQNCQLLRTATCTETYSKTWAEIKNDQNIAKKDGFKNAADMQNWFKKNYKNLEEKQLLDIIRW